MSLFEDPAAAVVQTAETLSQLGDEGRLHIHKIELGSRQTLDAARSLGLVCLKIKAVAEPGRFVATLEKLFPGKVAHCYRGLRILANWSKVCGANSTTAGLKMLSEDADEPEEDDGAGGASGKRRRKRGGAKSEETLADWLPRARLLARRLDAVQEELSLMLSEELVQPVVEQAASLSTQLKLFRTGETVKMGTLESGDEFGPPEYTCDALQTLQLMMGRLVSAIEREAAP